MKKQSGLFRVKAVDPHIIDETGFHLDALPCFGCHKEFSNTVRMPEMPDDHKYCGNCFFAMYGLKEYQTILANVNNFFYTVWHTPLKELPKSILSQIDWVDKSYPKRAGLL